MTQHGSPSGRPGGHGESKIDVRERGAERDGKPQAMDRRVFMQLLAFQTPANKDPAELAQVMSQAMAGQGVGSVVYVDVNDPRGLALLTFGEDPELFVTRVRPELTKGALGELAQRTELSMLGRTYSGGYEQDLEYWILERPMKTVLNADWPWAIWYPLRRTGEFARLGRKDQADILREHAAIGRAYGEQDLAHDVRLACHGLDQSDNEFVIGLVGRELHPLSHVVQTMRRTRQTSQYIAQMGPFFVGHALHRTTPA